jgi:phosphotransferase system enzyme I (PtsI)
MSFQSILGDDIMRKGIAASRGIAIGRVFLLTEPRACLQASGKAEDLQQEILRLDKAIESAINEIRAIKVKTVRELGDHHGEIFDAHITILQDQTLINDIEGTIKNNNSKAENAVMKTIDGYCSLFEQIDDEYLKERVSDFRDIASRLLKCLSGPNDDKFAGLREKSIIVTKDLTPSDTAQIDKSKVLGFVTDLGGRTSHTAIMARSLEIPAVLGLQDITSAVKTGDMLVVDGTAGIVIVNPNDSQLEEYREKEDTYIRQQIKMQELKLLPAQTRDGLRTVSLCINIGGLQDCESGKKMGARGVGLFRTEFLYMDRDSLPSEDEQFVSYKQVLEATGPHGVIIRTLDIGGDKHLPYLDMQEEMNPFLGFRAIRLCLKNPELFKCQLCAILRASHYGKARIMYPMISSKRELREANNILCQCKESLDAKNIPYDHNIEIGMMIEVPSAAIIADKLVDDIDFFSIGSNDLTQYTLAVDRLNQKISDLFKPLNPAILRLVKNVIDVSHNAGKWTGMCGEMAGEEKYTPLLLGLGLDEFSMSATSLLSVKQVIRNLTYPQAQDLAAKALEMSDPAEITELLKGYY